MRVLSLFDGISAGRLALERAGLNVSTYYASEIDKHAIKVTQYHHPDTIQIGDVTNVNGTDYKDIDLLIGGSPCQSFSRLMTSDQHEKGFEGKSGLFYEFIRVLKEVKPRYFMLENVRMKMEWLHEITIALGVEPVFINSSLVSAQSRGRYYWTNIEGDDGLFNEIGQPKDKEIFFHDVIEQHDRVWKPLPPWALGGWGNMPRYKKMKRINTSKSNTVTTDKSNVLNYYRSLDDKYITAITVQEAELLQTFPIGYTSMLSETQAYKALGNSWTVDVIAHIFSHIK